MKDRYLFKAKRLDNREWVKGALVYDDMDKLYRIIIELDYSTGTCIRAGKAPRVDASTICQCTGLKDKNGKLIWENDKGRWLDGVHIRNWSTLWRVQNVRECTSWKERRRIEATEHWQLNIGSCVWYNFLINLRKRILSWK